MVPGGSRSFLSGILFTQCGDPRAHRQEDFFHCASSHRFLGRGRDAAPVSHSKDKEVAQLGFKQRDITEGWVLSEVLAESCPGVEDDISGSSSFGDKSGVCGLQRKAEIS